MKDVNNKKILKESNIDLYQVQTESIKSILNQIYTNQKDLFNNVYLPKILEKDLVILNKYYIYDFINQQLTISILNELYEVDEQILQDTFVINDRYEFLYELIDIIHFVFEGLYITSEYVDVNLDLNSVYEKISKIINNKKVFLKQIDYVEECNKYFNIMYDLLSEIPNYYNWKHWKKRKEFNTEYNHRLYEIYKDMLYYTVSIFLTFGNLPLLQQMYDIKNHVNRERQNNGY